MFPTSLPEESKTLKTTKELPCIQIASSLFVLTEWRPDLSGLEEKGDGAGAAVVAVAGLERCWRAGWILSGDGGTRRERCVDGVVWSENGLKQLYRRPLRVEERRVDRLGWSPEGRGEKRWEDRSGGSKVVMA
ncbi:hypothetical protein FXO38_35511 [Capsicum annuum]|nr:hypothetical protein FXO38_35511 [Capsicum annuum]